MEKEKQLVIQKYDQKYIEMTKRETEAERKMMKAKEQLAVKGDLISEANKYKENYFLLFKNVIDLFTEWNKGIKVYFNPDIKQIQEPQATLDDPIEIVKILKKMVRISTPENLQSYVRKIIVSANQLQREFFPEFVNDRFDPEKIYERIFKMLKNLTKENERLKRLNTSDKARKSTFINNEKTKSVGTSRVSLIENKPDKFDQEMFWS